MALQGKAAVLIVLYWLRFGTCITNRDRTVFTKLSILENEIDALKSSIQRNEVSRKADLDILGQDIIIQLESIAAQVLSKVIDDKTRAGEISGVVEGSVNSLLQHQQHQLQQLKSFVKGLGNRQRLPVPRKADDNSKKINKRFRAVNKKVKNYESQIKELRDEILQQNLQILEFKSEFSEKMKILELQRKRKDVTEVDQNLLPTTPLSTQTEPVGDVDQGSTVFSVSKTVDEGDKVEMDCIASGNPLPDVKWSRLDAAMPGNAVSTGTILTIPEIDVDDEGTYICIATNSAGSSVQHVSLFIRGGKAVEACNGSNAILMCSYTETDDKVRWMRKSGKENDRLISLGYRVYIADRRFSVQRPYSSEWNLLIKSVSSVDEGIYTCLGSRHDFKSKFRLKVKSC